MVMAWCAHAMDFEKYISSCTVVNFDFYLRGNGTELTANTSQSHKL